MAIKNLTSLFPLIFLSKYINFYALGRLKWILVIIWPLNQHFKLKNQRNWLKQVWMSKFWSVINCFFMHWTKKLTLLINQPSFRETLVDMCNTISSAFDNIQKDWVIKKNVVFTIKFRVHKYILIDMFARISLLLKYTNK